MVSELKLAPKKHLNTYRTLGAHVNDTGALLITISTCVYYIHFATSPTVNAHCELSQLARRDREQRPAVPV